MLNRNREASPVEIIEASVADAESILNVQKSSWIDAYPNEQYGITAELLKKRFEDTEGRTRRWQNTLATPTSTIWLAKRDGVVVGFCGVQKTDEEHRLSSIYIDPRSQSVGIGTALMTRALAYLGRERDVILEDVSNNSKAIRFYQKFGFEIKGEVPPEKLLKVGDRTLPELQMVLKAL